MNIEQDVIPTPLLLSAPLHPYATTEKKNATVQTKHRPKLNKAAWELARSMVVGYIDEEDGTDTEWEQDDGEGKIADGNDGGEPSEKRDGRRSQHGGRRRAGSDGESARDGRGRAGSAETDPSIGNKPSSETTARAAVIAKAWVRRRDRRARGSF